MSPEATSGAAAERPRRRTDELLGTLADRIGARFSAASVYGTPIERDGVTVVPVAAARFGIGAGGGSDSGKGQDGEGGVGPELGGGAAVAAFPDVADQVAVVADGRGAMPSFDRTLTPQEIKAVVDYTREDLG